MNTINTVGNSPSTTSVYTPAQVNATDAVNTKATTMVEPSVAASVTPGKAVPILKPPSNPDYAGAKSVMSSYTALIVLMCEVNRESYAANRTMAKAQMNTRVAELHDVAAKRRTAAIVGLVLGVVSGAVGIAGGATGIAQSSKGLKQLNDLGMKQKQLAGHDPLLNDNTLTKNTSADAPKPADNNTGFSIDHDDVTTTKPLLDDDYFDNSVDDVDVPPAAIDKNEGFSNDHDDPGSLDPTKSGNKPQNSPEQLKADPDGDLHEVEAKSGNEPQKSPEQLKADLDVGLREVEAKSAGTQSMSVLFRALTDLTSSVGQSSSAMVSSQADEMAAEAEGTEASRQTTISNMQQFLDLMSKFTQILSSLLEAENKARSAAAQA